MPLADPKVTAYRYSSRKHLAKAAIMNDLPDEQETEVARRLAAAVADGSVTPRDAAIFAGLRGLKAFSEKKTDAADRFGVGARRTAQIESAVAKILAAHPIAGVAEAVAADVAQESEALVLGEVQLGDPLHRADAIRAMAGLTAQRRGVPVARTGADPQTGAARVRQHRLRKALRRRLSIVEAAPELSYSQPYLAVPWSLPARLCPMVPRDQLHRNKPPGEEFLAAITADLEAAYAARNGQADDLSDIALWAFARFPASPLPDLEARALRTCLIIARERGKMTSYWMQRRIGYLVGADHPETLFTTADSAITLRNHGYWSAANRLLASTLRRLQRAEVAAQMAALAQCRLLEQLIWNHSHAPPGSAGVSRADLKAARRLARIMDECTCTPGGQDYRSGALRLRFETELAEARVRARENRERFWLHPDGERAFALADRVSIREIEPPVFRTQWALTRMLVGVLRRDKEEIIEAAQSWQSNVAGAPWIARDSPNEVYGYHLHRARAVRVISHLDTVLPQPVPMPDDI